MRKVLLVLSSILLLMVLTGCEERQETLTPASGPCQSVNMTLTVGGGAYATSVDGIQVFLNDGIQGAYLCISIPKGIYIHQVQWGVGVLVGNVDTLSPGNYLSNSVVVPNKVATYGYFSYMEGSHSFVLHV